ncbi:MAG: ATP-binding protein [Caldisericia bacterium]
MFDIIIGQDKPKKILINIIKTKKIPNSFLFYGKEGIGKFSLAKEFGKVINEYKEGEFIQDIYIVENDKSIGIDEIRKVKELSFINPEKKYKIIIINDAHNLTQEASNSFLKVLEEPSKRTIFILITQYPERLPETIRSRCFKIHFSPIDRNLIKDFLSKKIEESEKIDLLSRICDGSLKKALLMMDENFLIKRRKRILSFLSFLKREKPYIDFLKELVIEEDIKEVIIFFEEIVSDMIIMKRSTDESLVLNIDFLKDIYETQILFSIENLLKIGELLFDFEKKIEYNINLALLLRSLFLGILELTGGIYV